MSHETELERLRAENERLTDVLDDVLSIFSKDRMHWADRIREARAAIDAAKKGGQGE